MALWLVRSTPDREVRVRAVVGTLCFFFLCMTLCSQCLSLHPGVQMGNNKSNKKGVTL